MRPIARKGGQTLALLAWVFVTALLPACTQWQTPGETISPEVASPENRILADAIAGRLAIGESVAWVKYQNSASIHDPVREQAVLDQVAVKAAVLGVNADLARDFFTAQMAASRQYQTELTRLWTRGETLPAMAPVDLARDIRPKLDQLTGELLTALKSTSWDSVTRSAVARELRIRGYSNAVVSQATSTR